MSETPPHMGPAGGGEEYYKYHPKKGDLHTNQREELRKLREDWEAGRARSNPPRSAVDSLALRTAMEQVKALTEENAELTDALQELVDAVEDDAMIALALRNAREVLDHAD